MLKLTEQGKTECILLDNLTPLLSVESKHIKPGGFSKHSRQNRVKKYIFTKSRYTLNNYNGKEHQTLRFLNKTFNSTNPKQHVTFDTLTGKMTKLTQHCQSPNT